MAHHLDGVNQGLEADLTTRRKAEAHQETKITTPQEIETGHVTRSPPNALSIYCRFCMKVQSQLLSTSLSLNSLMFLMIILASSLYMGLPLTRIMLGFGNRRITLRAAPGIRLSISTG